MFEFTVSRSVAPIVAVVVISDANGKRKHHPATRLWVGKHQVTWHDNTGVKKIARWVDHTRIDVIQA